MSALRRDVSPLIQRIRAFLLGVSICVPDPQAAATENSILRYVRRKMGIWLIRILLTAGAQPGAALRGRTGRSHPAAAGNPGRTIPSGLGQLLLPAGCPARSLPAHWPGGAAEAAGGGGWRGGEDHILQAAHSRQDLRLGLKAPWESPFFWVVVRAG